MEKYIEALSRSSLFDGMDKKEIGKLLEALQPDTKRYPKNTTIVQAGEKIQNIAVILSGAVQVSREDILGETTMVRNLHAGDVFGQNHVCAGILQSSVAAMALTESEIMFINYNAVLMHCAKKGLALTRLLENINQDIARNNFELTRKIAYMTIKSMRKRIYTYLLDESQKAGSSEFSIPLDRTALATYLNVDRSALSRELSRMREDGMLDFKKNIFFMYKNQKA